MKSLFLGLSALVLFAGQSTQHTAILPPFPDKALLPNTSEAPAGCKFLPSDKGWPADSVWKTAFPGVFKKLKGTVGPDWMIQAKNVSDVQKAVNFARERNVRVTIITTGHDFHGRETARSGLRIDLATLREPTVFSNEWKCGQTLKPLTKSGKAVDEIQVCKVPKLNRRFRGAIPQRDHEYKFFEKRDGHDCNSILKLHKRQGMMDPDDMGGMSMGGMPEEVPQYNTIKPEARKQAYARISAGMYNELFYTQADKSGLMTIGAQHGGVSVIGGWMQAGGHNPFSHKFGMQVDNVVEIEVVTADGKFQKVSECSNPQLFWALRGGGGSTFGVVTGATVKVYPTFPVTVTRFFVNSTKPGIMRAAAHFLQVGAKLRDNNGLQGYFYVYPGSFQSALHMPDEFATLKNAKAVTEPLLKKMEELAGSKKHIEPKYYQYKTYKDWYNAEYGNEEMEDRGEQFLSWNDGSDGLVPSEAQAMANPLSILPYEIQFPQYPDAPDNPVKRRSLAMVMKDRVVETVTTMMKRNVQAPSMGMSIMRSQPNPRHYLDSRLLSNAHVNSVSIQTLGDAINNTMPAIPGVHIRGFLIGGKKQAEPHKDAMGLLPAWRDMTYHFITNAVPGNVRHDYGIDALAKLFPDAGGYVNEASPGSPDWKRAYWGSHYPKLESLKRKYDPDNVFWCTPCVGADMLTYDDERICHNTAFNLTTLSMLGTATNLKPPPETYPNMRSKTGIASIKADNPIPHPMLPILAEYMETNKLPAKVLKSNYFKIAMGEGGSALGKFADNDPYNPGKKLQDWPLKW